MAYIVAATNNKGGSTKTTETIGVAHAGVDAGMRVLVVDCDLQGNATSYLTGRQYPDDWFDISIADVLDPDTHADERIHPREVIVPSQRDGLDVLPAGDLAAMERMERLLAAAAGKEFFLTIALEQIEDDYDLILIDSPPSVNVITANVHLAAKTGLIVVATPAAGDVAGIVKTVQTVEGYNAPPLNRLLLNPVQILGVVVARMDIRSKAKDAYLKQIVNLVAEFDIPVLGVPIPEWAFIAQATAVGASVADTGDSRAGFVQTQFAAVLDAIKKEG